jgi:hypothetical protein
MEDIKTKAIKQLLESIEQITGARIQELLKAKPEESEKTEEAEESVEPENVKAMKVETSVKPVELSMGEKKQLAKKMMKPFATME